MPGKMSLFRSTCMLHRTTSGEAVQRKETDDGSDGPQGTTESFHSTTIEKSRCSVGAAVEAARTFVYIG